MKAYEEIIDFIAAGATPHGIIAYQPSEAAKDEWLILFTKRKPPA